MSGVAVEFLPVTGRVGGVPVVADYRVANATVTGALTVANNATVGSLTIDGGQLLIKAKNIGNRVLLVRRESDSFPLAYFDDNGTTLGAYAFKSDGGVYTGNRFNGSGSTVYVSTASIDRAQVDANGLTLLNGGRFNAPLKTPASATATGTVGEVCWDANYVYVCTAASAWKRAALSTW